MKHLYFSLILILLSLNAFLVHGHSPADSITVPAFADKYSAYVRQLERGETDIDYQHFRFSFMESEQFKVAASKKKKEDKLVKDIFIQMNKSNYEAIIALAKQLLSIDYTNMLAHKMMGDMSLNIGDTINSAKHKAIQTGLLRSITDNGDGLSCETGWPVIQVAEEYFVLGALNATVSQQSLVKDEAATCDKMEVVAGGEKKTYYFEVSKVFEGYAILFGK